jgi:hypothetical protein
VQDLADVAVLLLEISLGSVVLWAPYHSFFRLGTSTCLDHSEQLDQPGLSICSRGGTWAGIGASIFD